MQEQFGITMNVFESLLDTPDKSIKKGEEVFASLDPWALQCLSLITKAAKSTAIGLCTMSGHLPIEVAVKASRVDENFQVKHFGLVEGAHDLDETVVFNEMLAAKTVSNLSLLRDI